LLRLKEIQPSYERTKSAVLCSAHFLDSDYTMFGSKKVLNKNVIPSIFKESMYYCFIKYSNTNYIKILLLNSTTIIQKSILKSSCMLLIFSAACKSLLRVFEDIPQNIEKENQNIEEICIFHIQQTKSLFQRCLI